MGNRRVQEEIMTNDTTQTFTKKKLITYFILTLIFIATSSLSIIFIGAEFGATSFRFFDLLEMKTFIWLAILLVLYFLFDTLRFMYVLKTLDIHLTFIYMVKLAFINIFVSNITPFATGGGLAQIYFLNKKGTPLGNATAAALIRTLLPIIFFFLTTPFILLLDQNLIDLFPSENRVRNTIILISVYTVLTYISYKVIKNPKPLKVIIYRTLYFLNNKNILSKKRVKKIIRFSFVEIDGFVGNIKLFFRGNKKYQILTILYTLLFLLSLFVFPAVLIHGMDYEFPTFSIIKIQTVITCITYFAITPGATGIAEGGFSLLFKKHVDSNDIAPLTFAWRFFTIYIGMIIGLLLFYIEMFSAKSKK
ncbi:lysylphosphatidylglycerol synthase transmembrane domain-containing protein [Haloplasma contractile]|uniref:Uncharacterized protein n=1 Tax=Haloplasma contractile SSD-17B TaxID=1033810 RepID=U2FLC9_9MOLU|nr:lysylphosphatidylglycerol synthase transmembrane domain-containing protein [Haloplasma contractile]ERJ13545.1 hypothetical protein HLPCO_000211 [Haloplasma contractile SSD-17B]